uniref:Uncharacterized protein n=1 Tax=Homalodisca liturata TaxID=320908 RepID=A0A1B6JV39_9HEMI
MQLSKKYRNNLYLYNACSVCLDTFTPNMALSQQAGEGKICQMIVGATRGIKQDKVVLQQKCMSLSVTFLSELSNTSAEAHVIWSMSQASSSQTKTKSSKIKK